MSAESYLQWLARATPTRWWHDSGDVRELDEALAHGASGVTTNPILVAAALASSGVCWRRAVDDLFAETALSASERAEQLAAMVVRHAAERLKPVFDRTQGRDGYVCAQVNPAQAADREAMWATARRFRSLAPNVTVKLPATAAGLDVMEACLDTDIPVTLTVSFTVPQVMEIARRYNAAAMRARHAGRVPPPCVAVIMIGRLDDYLRDVAADRRADVTEADIRQAGLAVVKRAATLCGTEENGVTLCVAALRGVHHMTGLAGGRLIMSVHPRYQRELLAPGVPREEGFSRQAPADALERLRSIPEFVRAYEPDGLRPDEFLSFGLTQRTLAQFVEAGWSLIERYQPPWRGNADRAS